MSDDAGMRDDDPRCDDVAPRESCDDVAPRDSRDDVAPLDSGDDVAPGDSSDGAAPREQGDDEPNQESVDRAFAELVAGFHLTADRPDPPTWARPDSPARAPGAVFEAPPLPREDLDPAGLDLPGLDEPAPDAESEVVEEGFDPGPPPPLPRPAWPVLVGWIGLGYAMLTVLLVAIRVPLPSWAAWAGVIGFVGGFGLLISRLPRQRPPDAGDGAVL